jgi:8-oxo-dGTP pyrophosphatase MutT (NUDIX family)
MSARFKGYEVVSDERVGEGGFLRLRRLRLRVRREDGSLSDEGLYDYVERPMGRDAVVLVLWHRGGDGVRVLLRTAPRVPMWFGRGPDIGRAVTELVAGILEAGEDDWPAIQRRAAAEALEEAGVRIAPESVQRLGPPLFPTVGMYPELFHFVMAEVRDPSAAEPPPTDGSPFEEGAALEWLTLEAALARCAAGTLNDLKTECALRRLREQLGHV